MLGATSIQYGRQSVTQQSDERIGLEAADKCFENKQYGKAATMYFLLANTGNREAQFKFGLICEYGLGGREQDYAQALDWYVKAAKNGSEEALERINSLQIDSDCFFSRGGEHIEKHVERLIASCNNVGSMYRDRGNIEAADKWVVKGFALCYAKNAIHTAKQYIQRQLNEVELKNLEGKLLNDAQQYFEEQQFETAYIIWAFSAENGSAEAECRLGLMYLDGKGVAKNVEKGMELLESSGELGDVDAQYCLGAICESSEQDYAQALNWYVKAAKNGSELALEKIKSIQINAEYLCGRSHLPTFHVVQLIDSCKNIVRMYGAMPETVDNLTELNKWQDKVDALQNAQILVEGAQLNGVESHEIELLDAAQSYYEEMQYEAAYIIWRFLAKRNNAEAEFYLGTMYYSGEGVVQDIGQGIQWLERSAAHGDVDAQHDLGCHYLNGDDVPQNVPKAINYFKMAANNEYADGSADFQLGEIYFAGELVNKDIDLALIHYKTAVRLGSREAQDKIDLLCTPIMDKCDASL